MNMRAAMTLVAAILVSAPHALGQASGAAAPQRSRQVLYLPVPMIDLIRLLPPPPRPGSPEEKRDIASVLSAQNSRTTARSELAQADGTIDMARFAGVLGPKFKVEPLAATSRFFSNVARSTGRAISLTKDCWLRPRPFELDERIQPLGDLKPALRMRPSMPRAEVPLGPDSPCVAAKPTPAYIYSYPSGHATWGAMTAMLLAEMVPEKRTELFARGWEFGESRVVGGVHFPSDVEAGRTQAAVLVALMMLNEQFRADLAEARAELREALGLLP